MHFFTCIASSLVGQITTTPVPLRGAKWTLCNNSTAGIRNARVFPEPVLAAPRTSFPTRSGGIALAWICICNDTSDIRNFLCANRAKYADILHCRKLQWTVYPSSRQRARRSLYIEVPSRQRNVTKLEKISHRIWKAWSCNKIYYVMTLAEAKPIISTRLFHRT